MSTAILRHKKTNVLYRHIEGNKFRNLITGAEGEVSPEIAKNIFAISVPATIFCNENPVIEKFISALALKIEPEEIQTI